VLKVSIAQVKKFLYLLSEVTHADKNTLM